MDLVFDEDKERDIDEKEAITVMFQSCFGLDTDEVSTTYTHKSDTVMNADGYSPSVQQLQQFIFL